MLNTDNTVCLVVDVQERLLPGLAQNAEMENACRVLLQGLAALGVPVAATEQYPKGLGRTVPALSLLLGQVPVWEKTRFSAWIPEFREWMAQYRVENVILIGAETHICMLQTALDMAAEGLGVWVPFECTSSRSPDNKANGLQQMRDAGAVVTNVESVLFGLMKDARHPEFKTVAKLIR